MFCFKQSQLLKSPRRLALDHVGPVTLGKSFTLLSLLPHL